MISPTHYNKQLVTGAYLQHGRRCIAIYLEEGVIEVERTDGDVESKGSLLYQHRHMHIVGLVNHLIKG